MREKIRDVFVILAGTVGAATFVFSVVSDYLIDRERDIRDWQKAYVFELLSKEQTQPMTFSQIQESFQDAGDVHLLFEIPKKELHPSATRRILLELISDGTLVQFGEDSFAINVANENSQNLWELAEIHRGLIESEQERHDNMELWRLKKALVHDIVANSEQGSVSLETVRDRYRSRVASNDKLAPTAKQMDLLEARRVILELISDRVVVQSGLDNFMISVPSAEDDRILNDFRQVLEENRLASTKSQGELLAEQIKGQDRLMDNLEGLFGKVVKEQQESFQEQLNRSLLQVMRSHASLADRLREIVDGQQNIFQEAKESRVDDQTRQWQKVIVFEIIAGQGEESVNLDRIRNIFESSKSEYESYGVPSFKLDRAEARLALLELVADGVIVQTGQDSFAVDPKKNMLERMMEMSMLQKEMATLQKEEMSDMRRRREILEDVVATVANHPGRYTHEELVETTVRTKSVPKHIAHLSIMDAARMGGLMFGRRDNKAYLIHDLPDDQ